MEKKKNFKCLNKSCGVSYTANSLGPCPVCGNEDTKLDKNRKLLCILLWAGLPVLISMGIWIIVFSPFNDSDNVVKTPKKNDPDTGVLNPIVSECDLSEFDLLRVDFDCDQNNIEIFVYPDSCNDLEFSIDDGQKTKSKTLKIDPEKDNFSINAFDENGTLIKSFIRENDCNIPKTSCGDLEDLIAEFQKDFEVYISNPYTNSNKQSSLTKLSKKIGLKNNLINSVFDNNSDEFNLEDLLDEIYLVYEFDAIIYKSIGGFIINTKIVDGNCQFSNAEIKLRKRN